MKYIKILRIQQWSKNLIIFLPLTLLQEFETLLNIEIYLIFFSFSLLVSSTYIFNDIRDQDQDKLHPKKKIRPIASGEMSKTVAKNYGSV
ncbi:MAG: UbiA family prenyltransferase, partial [Flavobacteriaceae bacterium]